jgi:flagellar export protein FliJ
MKRFKFPLQAVLTVRSNEERKALEAFSKAQAEVERIVSRKDAAQRQIDELFAKRQEVLTRPATAQDIHRMQNSVKALQLQLQQCNIELEKARIVLAQTSRALLDARQKREVVDKVFEKQLANYKTHAAQLEQKLIDDIATMKGFGGAGLRWR